MKEALRYLIEEIKALGWRCAAFGPEFWLAVAALAGACALALVIGYLVYREDEDERR